MAIDEEDPEASDAAPPEEGEGETYAPPADAAPQPAPPRAAGNPFLSTVRQLENSGDQAVSPKGAIGRYQIMPETAKGLGYDPQDRFIPAKNEEMAAKLGDQLDKQYGGDRDAMLVAYNAGPKVADKWLAADRDNSVLPQETQKYLQRAAAIQTTPQLPQVFERAAQARAAGYSWDDIDSFLMSKRAESQAAGYSDDEINRYLGLPQPKDMATARGQLLGRGYKPEDVDGLIKALTATATPTAGDVLKPQGWSTESATQFFGQKVINGIHALLELNDGKPKTKEEEDGLKQESNFAQTIGESMLGTADAETAQGRAIGGFGKALGETVKQLVDGMIETAKIPGEVARGEYGTMDDPRFQGAARQFAANFGALKPVIDRPRAPVAQPQILPTVKDALDAAVSVTKGGAEGDLNAAFGAIGEHYVQTGTHPIDAAYQAQKDHSLAAKLAGRFIGDEAGALRLGPEAPEFPYPREAPELPINVYSIQQKNPALSAQVLDDLKLAFAPYNRGEQAAEAAAILRHGQASVVATDARVAYTLRSFGRSVGELTPAQKMDFVHAFETGEVPELFKGAPLGDLAAQMHKLLDVSHAAMAKRGIVESYIENYLPHLWRDPEAARSFFSGQSMAGPRQFTKERVYATYRDGMEHGLAPLTTNPIEIAINGLHQMSKAITAHDMMSENVQRGIVRPVPYGEGLRPGESFINDGIVRPSVAGQEGNRYAAPDPVATIINRAYSPGWQKYSIYRLTRNANNLMNMAQLGLSGFHAGFLTGDAFYSQLAQSAKQLSRFDLGEAGEAAKTFVTAPAAPVRNAILGWKVWNQAIGAKDYGPAMQTLADKMIAGGFRFSMDKQYAGTASGSFWNAFKGEVQKMAGEPTGEMTVRQDLAQMFQDSKAMAQGTIIPAQVRFIGNLVPRIMQTVMGPLMEFAVPAMKAGAMANLLRDELRVNPSMDLMTLRHTAGRLSNTVDDRLGELVYDNTFWNKVAKDIGQIAVRALGWNIGDIRQLGGGVLDLPQGRKIKAGEFRQITEAASYVIMFPVGTAMLNATWGFLHGTWSPDWGLREYFGGAPTGGKADKRGDPEQAMAPGYMKDAIEWATHPYATALSKASPLASSVWYMMNNKDWSGASIADHRSTALGKVGDYGKFIAEQFLPMVANQLHNPQSAINPWENFFGIKAAPHAVREFFGEKPTEHELREQQEADKQKVRMERERR